MLFEQYWNIRVGVWLQRTISSLRYVELSFFLSFDSNALFSRQWNMSHRTYGVIIGLSKNILIVVHVIQKQISLQRLPRQNVAYPNTLGPSKSEDVVLPV